MKIAQIRKYREKPALSPQLIATNPVLLLGLDLPFIVVAATSLKNGVALSIEMFFIHIIAMFIAWGIAKVLPIWQRFFVISFASTVVMLLSRRFVVGLIPSFEFADSMYLYLIALNGMTLFQACYLKKDAKLSITMKSALLNVLSFAAIMLSFSALREYLGGGTLWGQAVPIVNKLSGVRSPFFGFILLGLLLAVSRFVVKQVSALKIIVGIRRDEIKTAQEKEVEEAL